MKRQTSKKILANYLIRGWYPKYIKNSHNSVTKIIIINNPILNGQKIWLDILPKTKNGHEYMKWCSKSLIIREMQIKTTTHLLKWLSSKGQEITSVNRDVEMLVRCWYSQYGKQSDGFSKKIKHRTTSNATSGYIPKENENRISKKYLHFHFRCSIIHNSQDRKTTYVSINRWMDEKKWDNYIYGQK